MAARHPRSIIRQFSQAAQDVKIDHYLTGDTQAPKNVTVLGGKTGTTSDAGSCLSLVTQNAFGQPFISVIVKAKDKDTLYTDMNTMLSQINS